MENKPIDLSGIMKLGNAFVNLNRSIIYGTEVIEKFSKIIIFQKIRRKEKYERRYKRRMPNIIH